MNAHQRRLGKKEAKRKEARAKAWDRAAKRRDVDEDMPHYLRHDIGRVDGDLREDRMPPVVRGHRGMK